MGSQEVAKNVEKSHISFIQLWPTLASYIGWYRSKTRKLTLAEYSELDNRSHLDLTRFICTFFFLDWHLQVENTQYEFPKSSWAMSPILALSPSLLPPSFPHSLSLFLPGFHSSILRTNIVPDTVLCVGKIGEGRQSWLAPPPLPPSLILIQTLTGLSDEFSSLLSPPTCSFLFTAPD